MYMMYPSRPTESAYGKFYMEPALGNMVVPQYLEPALAGSAVADAVSTFAFPALSLVAAVLLLQKKKTALGVGALLIGGFSAVHEMSARGVFAYTPPPAPSAIKAALIR